MARWGPFLLSRTFGGRRSSAHAPALPDEWKCLSLEDSNPRSLIPVPHIVLALTTEFLKIQPKSFLLQRLQILSPSHNEKRS